MPRSSSGAGFSKIGSTSLRVPVLRIMVSFWVNICDFLFYECNASLHTPETRVNSEIRTNSQPQHARSNPRTCPKALRLQWLCRDHVGMSLNLVHVRLGTKKGLLL